MDDPLQNVSTLSQHNSKSQTSATIWIVAWIWWFLSPLVACASTKEKDCGEKLRLLAAGEICDIDEIGIEMGGGEAGPPGPPGT